MSKIICLGLLAASFISLQSFAADDTVQQMSNPSRSLSTQASSTAPSTIDTKPLVILRPKRANFKRNSASHEARQLADWVVDSGDNLGMPFVIVDKKETKVFVFHPDGQLRGAARVLLGQALGDEAVPGIGTRKLSSILPEERTTPAGRFVASMGRNLSGVEILWVDYANAISMHRVITTKPKERRLQRLATLTSIDKRISYGCINVPVKFFNKVVRPTFTRTTGIVYVMPEISSSHDVFGSYVVEEFAPEAVFSKPGHPTR